MVNAPVVLRPYGVFVSGHLELGIELVLEGGEIKEIRPHTGIPEPFVVSPAFVNAHSHLEYRGLQGMIHETEYWPWIRELTRLKLSESLIEVRDGCRLAARENRASGVALIGEHSDRPFAGEALCESGISGVIYQEIITFFESDDREAKLGKVKKNAEANGAEWEAPRSAKFSVTRHPGRVVLSPHAYQTVDRKTLKEIAQSGEPFSIHVGETPLESEFTITGTGDIADFYKSANVPYEPTGKNIVETLHDLGLARQGAQFVHCCAVSQSDIDLMVAKGVAVVHCPRSNVRLGCPPAPVREMLDTGAEVGLGMDSPASSGPIDMFDEMRAALQVSMNRGRPLKPEEIWRMATVMGAASLPVEAQVWEVAIGSKVPLIKINVTGALHARDVIEQASASDVNWV